jgi:hypothetical protein
MRRKGLGLAEIRSEFSAGNHFETDRTISKRIDDVAGQIAEAVKAAMQSLIENSKP